jgi:methionyl-tRNA formyltransferase
MVDAGFAAQSLRLVFFGTPDFATPTLEALLASQHQILAVVTQPDRPRGRGQQLSDAPVKALALTRDVPVLQPERLKDEPFIERLRGLAPDLGIVAAYGKILPDEVLAIPRQGLINVHASLLPKYRGAAPVHRAVIAGERETGVTIMRVVHDLDAGPMLDWRRRPIAENETSVEVEAALARLGADLAREIVDRLASGAVPGVPQDSRDATYAPRLTRADGIIDWQRPARALHDLVRGLHPWPHASAYVQTARYLVHRSRVSEPPASRTAAPGSVLEATSDRLLVAAGGGSALQILEIQPEGRRVMTAREFLAGHRMTPDTRFTAVPGVP